MAHLFVTGGEASESERPLTVGGAGSVETGVLDGFDYVALGHLHRAQNAGRETVRYPGSPLAYSFGEAGQRKGVDLVEMDGAGRCRVEQIALTPRREVRCVEGHLKEILEGPRSGQSREDYLQIRLLDKGPILDVMGKLREVYPNVLHVDRPHLYGEAQAGSRPRDFAQRSDEELLDAFFLEATGELLEEAQRATLREVLATVRRAEEEGSA